MQAMSQSPRRTAAAAQAAARSRQRVVAVAARKAAGKAASTAAYICLDCGWVYDGSKGPFEKLPNNYRCPVCNSPKKRFVPKEPKGKGTKGAAMKRGQGDGEIEEGDKSFFLVAAAAGAAVLAGLYFALSSQVS
ncbi:MAG: rubredoxin-like protein [Monoraphidium minutum]|nr:MAG: rubredoxin-like protein [Monoraphidium minutum]